MPTKNNMELGPGTLYFMSPEGGDPVYCGECERLEYTQEDYTPEADTPALGSLKTIPAEFTMELEPLSMKEMFYLTGDPAYMARWALTQNPRLAHLVRYAKKGRARKKNVHRLVAFMIEELKNETV